MRILAAVQSLFAAALLLVGLVTLFSIGITGLVFLLPAGVFAATAGAVSTGSKASVLLALGVDAPLAALAAIRLPESKGIEMAVPAVTVTLVVFAFIAVLLDWRTVRDRKWFAAE